MNNNVYNFTQQNLNLNLHININEIVSNNRQFINSKFLKSQIIFILISTFLFGIAVLNFKLLQIEKNNIPFHNSFINKNRILNTKNELIFNNSEVQKVESNP